MKAKGNTPAVAADGYADIFYSARDGLRLHASDYGRSLAAAGPLPLVCLPGLTRNARDFHQFARIISGADERQRPRRPRRVVVFDYRGRGGSEWDRNAANYNLAVETDDTLDGLAAAGIHRAAFFGTSRGALIIHMLTAMRPTVFAAAILNDAGPVIEGAGLAQIKSYLTRMPSPKDRSEARTLLRQAHGAAFPALTDADRADMADAIYKERKGRLAADYDPAIVRQLANMDFNTPLPTLWRQFDGLRAVPLMAIRGANSQLLSEATLAEMKARRPDMRAETVEGHGHAPIPHLAGLPQKVAAFLDEARV